MIVSDLARQINILARLDAEGWLEDYQLEVAEATRGPRDDLERFPHYRYQVGRFARIASTLFGVPIGVAHEAACEALLPSTRRGIALQILDEFEQRLDDAAANEQAANKLRTFNRRVGA